MKDNCILTAESVTEGHPDKLCDTIADAVVDACLTQDAAARVACEVMATAGKIIAAGEITAAKIPDIPCHYFAGRCGKPDTAAAAMKWRSSPMSRVPTLRKLCVAARRPVQEIRESCTATPAMKQRSCCPCLWCWPID